MTVDFAHPVERELARLFDEHGIVWEYEPHTFVLERDEEGNVREGFTPDFFLPQLDLYLECTVMRQALTGRKRRKARKTHARTGAAVEIVFRRDFDRLARRWDLPALARASRADARVSHAGAPGIAPSMRSQRPTTLEDDERVHIDVEQSNGTSVVTLAGDMDLHSAPELRDRLASLMDAGAQHLVLDLSETTFLDSMALGVLLQAKKRLTSDSGQLDLVVPEPDLRRIFEITMLDRIFDLHESREEALSGGPDGPAR